MEIPQPGTESCMVVQNCWIKAVRLAFCVEETPSKSRLTPFPPLLRNSEIQFCVNVFLAVVEVKKVEWDENKVAQKEILTPLFLAAVTAELVDHANEVLLLAPVEGLIV